MALWQYGRLALYAGGGIASALTSALYYFQNELIYPRNLPVGARTEVPSPSQLGLSQSEDLRLPTADGETLHAYLVRPENARLARPIAVMMLHGNAGNIGHRLPIARVLSEDLGCTVLMLQYRGYGLSTGTPGEKGIALDAQTGLDYLRRRPDLEGHRVVVYGQSIGGAVAVGLAAANQGRADTAIAALILENTFLSIAKLIPSVMPAARYLTPLCHEKWPSDEYILKIRDVPILFLSGLKDEIVPPSHMKKLHELCQAPKVWRELPHGDHNSSVAEPGYFQFIDEFLRKYVS